MVAWGHALTLWMRLGLTWWFTYPGCEPLVRFYLSTACLKAEPKPTSSLGVACRHETLFDLRPAGDIDLQPGRLQPGRTSSRKHPRSGHRQSIANLGRNPAPNRRCAFLAGRDANAGRRLGPKRNLHQERDHPVGLGPVGRPRVTLRTAEPSAPAKSRPGLGVDLIRWSAGHPIRL